MKMFEHLPYQNGIVVAVSGGADSMSLTLLMNEWCKENNVPFYAMTVDHKLRPESTEEAWQVKSWLSSYQINHHILSWHHEPLESRIQERARQARYQLLEEWCNANNIKVLATAHHAMDQWETFMMRLSKGSGCKGLSGILPIRTLGKIWLIRPILSMLPEQLHQCLQTQQFLDDPSNINEKFERIRWRNNYEMFVSKNLDVNTITKVSSHMQFVQEFLNELIQQAEITLKWDTKTFCLSEFSSLHPLIGQGFLQKILQEIGQSVYPCSQRLLKSLYQQLMDKNFKATTGGGCVLRLKKHKIVQIAKENRFS